MGRTPKRAGILKSLEESGLTQKEFALREGIAVSTLHYWLRRERLQQKIDEGDTALVAVTEPSTSAANCFTVTKGSLRIEIPRDASVEEWRRVHEALTS